jgi:signal transduction histidine kinase/CheY-like chemotaxis protein
LTRTVGLASALYFVAIAAASLSLREPLVWFGDFAQLVPPLGFAALACAVGQRSSRQVRVFWTLNAVHGVLWAIGQAVWTYYEVAAGGVPIISPTDPIFFLSSIPLAAALYGRPDRDRPRWLFDIVLLDIVLIALFAVFTYAYFALTVAVTDGPEDVYNANLTQLFNARNLLLALWAAHVWFTATSPAWRRVLGIYAAGLALAFAGGLGYDAIEAFGSYTAGTVSDLAWMLPYGALCLAAARAYDDCLFEPTEAAPPLARLPVVSLIAVALLILIPTVDEVSRRLFDVSPAAQDLRTRLALAMMIPFGVVVFVREFLSRRALLAAGTQLVATKEQLAQKEKLAAVGQLVSGVAHELNNPLQGVLGYAELLSMTHRDAPAAEELNAIRENANRAAGIVRNLLAFAGRTTPRRSWQQINAIVEEAAQRRRPLLQFSGISLELRLAPALPPAYIDSTRFHQVLNNLLENAETAVGKRQSGRDPASAVPRTEPGEIIISTSRGENPDRIVIEVADNGSGVRTEHLNKIFDPFFTTRGAEGTGLGLSVCHGIVREHGGLIHGRNRDNGGAAFVVELPVSPDAGRQGDKVEAPRDAHRPPPPAAPLTHGSEPSRAARRAKALVVDDEDSNATLVRRALDQAGYDVDSTTLSRRALVMIERTAYDVVIADIKMPELNGQELYTRSCQLRPEMSRRFIFITGDIDGEETLEFLGRSQCTYFMKPFNLERLTASVDLLVNGRRGDGRVG